ncbi:MAG TPA: acyl-CoA thioesterase [Geomonas sp.]
MTRPNDTTFYQTLALSSDQALRRRFMVIDDPELQGNLRFGLLLEILDKVAEETALRYVNRFFPQARVVTAAIDKILVRHAADVTKDLRFDARINHVGRSSLEIGIRVSQPGEPANHVASCYFTMVARSTEGEREVSLQLPPLEYDDPTEQKRAQKALARREDYKLQKAALLEPPSRQEYEMFTALHKIQDAPGFQGMLVGRIATDSWERMVPEFENVPQKIFGGYLIRRAYELAAICSELVAPDRSIVAAVNRINFYEPVRMGDKLHYTAQVVYTQESFICVEANIERISADRTTRALSNSCLFTFVNVDRNLAHRSVPQVYPTTYAEEARYLAAHRSYKALAEHYHII